MMAAQDLISFLSQALFVLVFVAVVIEAVRHPRQATFDTALLFGVTSLIIAETWVFELIRATPPAIVGPVASMFILAMPYLLLRLLDDFSGVPSWLLRLAEALLVLSAVALFAVPVPAPLWLTLLEVLYFVALTLYDTIAFFQAGVAARGIGRRRLLAVGFGSAFLTGTIFLAGVTAAGAHAGGALALAGQVLGLASGVGYFLGFAPPRWLRQAWQAPEVQAFFSRAVGLAHLPDDRSIVNELEQGVAACLGRNDAYLALWNEAGEVLEFGARQQPPTAARQANLLSIGATSVEGLVGVPPRAMLAGRAFSQQQPMFSANVRHDDPDYGTLYRAWDIGSIMAAPVTAAGRPLGVLVVYDRRAPLFAEDDLGVLKLLADYVAMILESSALIQESARLAAQRELEQLKDEFLAAAAHDLKTPLTSIKGLSQITQRRLSRPGADLQQASGDLRMIDDAAARMSGLIDELLDISRLQMDRGLDLNCRPIDLVALVQRSVEVRSRIAVRHQLSLQTSEPALSGSWDEERLERVLSNLLDNAMKYSPQGGPVTVTVRRERRGETDWAMLSVADGGIGIAKGDLQRIFERFQRGTNVAHTKIVGTGIGLAYVRQVAEQHGGEIFVDSTEGEGATFTVGLPLSPPAPAPAVRQRSGQAIV